MGKASKRKASHKGFNQATKAKNPPDMGITRLWHVVSYNETLGTYILFEITESKSIVITCLQCKEKLIPTKNYYGFKDENKYFVPTSQPINVTVHPDGTPIPTE